MSFSTINWATLNQKEQVIALARPEMSQNETLSIQVADIINEVKSNGDQALYSMTEAFDKVSLSTLAVSADQIEKAWQRLSLERKDALRAAYQQIEAFHKAQVFEQVTVETTPGVICTLKSQPIESVGLYVPAGSAPLPSTVLMLGVPAKIAKCDRKVLVCPPNSEGELADEVLAAAKLCGITEIYTIGGAQACAALAYGTETIKPVNKIFGPGNRFVTEAKKQLSQQVPGFAIDMPAGPSEVLVIADELANPAFVAADLLSQAEHGPDSQVILVSNAESTIEAVKEEVEKQIATLSRKEIAQQALAQSRFILTTSIEQSVKVSNEYGPEHLIVQVNSPEAILESLRNAGSIFLGAYTPESAGDYASGTNHVLPTFGYSKVVSSLTLADFSRRYTVQSISKSGLAALAPAIIELTDAEGLDAHQRAVTIRLEDTLKELS